MIIQVDSSILLSCREGNKQSFAELFKSYEKYLFNLCMGYTGNEYDALDLVQEAFTKAYRNFDKSIKLPSKVKEKEEESEE